MLTDTSTVIVTSLSMINGAILIAVAILLWLKGKQKTEHSMNGESFFSIRSCP